MPQFTPNSVQIFLRVLETKRNKKKIRYHHFRLCYEAFPKPRLLISGKKSGKIGKNVRKLKTGGAPPKIDIFQT